MVKHTKIKAEMRGAAPIPLVRSREWLTEGGRGVAEEQRARRLLVHGQVVAVPPLAPGLHVAATPIGNLKDVTLRALEALAGADAILAEDTRVTRILLSHYGISTPLVAYHEHNETAMRPQVLARLGRGEALALVSDAGTPLVSDPGFKLVEACLEAGFRVEALPGASALLTALVSCGLSTDRFLFEGFLPPRGAARRARLAELAAWPATLVFYESPRRIAEALADCAAILGADRPAAVARELTKKFEETRRGTLGGLAAAYAHEEPRGEIVLVVGPPAAGAAAGAGDLDARIEAALATHSVKDAADIVAGETGQKRRFVYARALQLAAGRGK